MGNDGEYDNAGQYAGSGIPRYEKIFGEGYISTGGFDTTKLVVEKMTGLGKDSKVLDVGSGIGGSAFYMHDQFGASVVGVDLSPPMYREAVRKLGDRKGVSFFCEDAIKKDYGGEKFDFLYSRDTLLHIADKEGFIKSLSAHHKEGGMLIITDYAFRNDEANLHDDFITYYKTTGYSLTSLEKYGKAIEAAGYKNVQVIDWTDMFLASLEKELKRMEEIKDEFIAELCEEDWQYLVKRWQDKVGYVKQGDQKWGLFIATK